MFLAVHSPFFKPIPLCPSDVHPHPPIFRPSPSFLSFIPLFTHTHTHTHTPYPSPFTHRRHRILKFLAKRKRRVWTKKIKYSVRKNFADSRLRLKGRFVKKEEENTLKTSIMERLEKKLGKEELDIVLNDETRLEEEVALLGVTLA